MADDALSAQQTNMPLVIPYASIEFANSYFGQAVSRRARWASIPDEDATKPVDKIGALREATLNIDTLTFQGYKYLINQPRAWPRFVAFGTYGDIFYLEQKIPIEVAWACCEQAFYLAENALRGFDVNARLDHQDQGVSSIQRAGASEQADLTLARRTPVCKLARIWLNDYIAKTGNLEHTYRYPTAD